MSEKNCPANPAKRINHPTNFTEYLTQYERSINNSEEFWAEQAHNYLSWYKPWHTVLSGSLNEANVRWFEGASLNVCYNCVDRHLPNQANTTALIWQGNEPDQVKYITYAQLHEQICRLANVLINYGVKKGDRVCIYLPMIPEAVIAMLACATLICMLMRAGDEPLKQTQRTSLRLLGSVGEPINPEVWQWYYEIVGKQHCPIIDTWWQTETGGFMITSYAEVTALKPGYAGLPCYGINAEIVDDAGKKLTGASSGNLIITQSWPGQVRTIYGDHQRFINTYLSTFPGVYFTGDGALRDEQGLFCITGRVDDVIKPAGHRIGTAEIESALVNNTQIAEAAVVGYQHPVKGEGICAFVIPKQGIIPDAELKTALLNEVTQHIGAIAKPDIIYFVNNLPKTRSGKIMRRILRKIVEGDTENLGDLSTLAEPEVIKELLNLPK